MARRRKTKQVQAAVVGLQTDGQPNTTLEEAGIGNTNQTNDNKQHIDDARNNKKPLDPRPQATLSPSSTPDLTTLTTTSSIASSPTLGHKLRLLLLDLTTLNKNPAAARRLDKTLSMHYISAPYFTPSEADIILNAVIDVEVVKSWRGYVKEEEGELGEKRFREKVRGKRFEDGVVLAMEGFMERRKKSGDLRPCGPHHVGPLYGGLFGVEMKELEEEGFLVRARREGFGGRRR